VGVGATSWFYSMIQPASGGKDFSFFVINKGASVSQVGNKLESSGFIKSALAFKIYIQATSQTNRIIPGEFRLSPSFNLFQTAATLFKGPVELWVTVPEGLRREEIALKFTSGLDKNQAFTNEFLEASKGKEGYLFPDTYLFPMDASASSIVKKMTNTFSEKTASFVPAGSDLSFAETVVLASILERETKTDTERPVVAGIMLNRLDIGMPLQVDASVQYAVGTPKNWWPILTLEDLKTASAFNTYKNAGVPPSPISNPGISSLKAMFNPEKSEYLYYIHDPTGQIHYAKTLSEHNANIAKYLGK